jgi:hypothetical protein
MISVSGLIHAVFAIVSFGGWPLFLFLCFHAHRYGPALVVALAIATSLIGAVLASYGVGWQTPIPLYAWLALPYFFTVVLIVLRHVRRGSTPTI